MHKPVPGKHRCTRCNKMKSHIEFYVDARKKSGISSWCKKCSLEVARTAAEKRKKRRRDALNRMHKVPQKEVD